jgi:membrane protease YdiL (CAAX protease family)
MNKRNKIILIYSVIACLLLYITENIFHPTYAIQMIQKVLSFIVIPIILSKYLWFTFWKFWKVEKSSILYWFWFGLFWAIVIWLSYYLLRDSIQWWDIASSLNSRGITSTTFIFIFIYIMFWNSLVEEYFFRWIIFRSLKDFSKKFSYIISSTMFALYHFAIFGTWFHWYLLWLALFWLFVWGLFFAWLYEETKWIWWAWIFHIIADFVILVIWYIEFFSTI